MKKFFDLQNNDNLVHISAFGILITSIWANIFSLGDAFYSDPFHHGEFVATLPSVLSGNLNFFTIHGAMDWLPALLSQELFGLNQYFFLTKLIYVGLQAVAALLLYTTIVLLTSPSNQYRPLILIVSAILAVYIVGYRDVFLLLTIYVYFLTDRYSPQKWGGVFEMILGVVLAINLLWSFDRGIIGIAGVGSAYFILMTKEKKYSLLILSFLLTLCALYILGKLSFLNYIENFKFLVATSAQWSQELSKSRLIRIFAVTVLNGWAIYCLIKQFYQEVRIDWGKTANLLLLAILTILMYKIGINRADKAHVIQSLWMPALTFMYLSQKYTVKWTIFLNISVIISLLLLAKRTGYSWLYFGALVPVIYIIRTRYQSFTCKSLSPKLVAVVIAISMLFININKISLQYAQKNYEWMLKVSAPPINQALVSENIKWVSSEILESDSRCIFDLSNNGVINGITNLPACTKYTYPVYATQRYEADMLKELQQQNPPVVVFSSTYWSFSIDGKSMHDRFPAVKNYLLTTYPYEKCNLGYCLRYVNQPS